MNRNVALAHSKNESQKPLALAHSKNELQTHLGLSHSKNKPQTPLALAHSTVRMSWKALVDRSSPEGKLGFVQPVGHDPSDIDADHTDAFRLGAVLFVALEALEVGKMELE